MKVSTKGRYGLRVMIELALQAGKGPVLVGILAEAQDLPPKYLHILLGSLRAAGLVRASRGPNGGYELAREASQITALEVVETLEGRILLSECGGHCARMGACAAQGVWEEAAASMAGVLGSYTLADLAERQRGFKDDPSGYSI